MNTKLDIYTIEARIAPVLVTFLPLGLAVIAWFPAKFVGQGLLTGVLTSIGMTALLAQFGRDLGKRKEPNLFKSWGGAPTTQMLRYRDSKLNSVSLERYRKKLESLVNKKLPSEDEEQKKPKDADTIYLSCVDYLRINTKDSKRFPLVCSENINYGFRRNLWGLKPIGIIANLIALISTVLLLYLNKNNIGLLSPIVFFVVLIEVLFLGLWIFAITTRWVKIAADAYAKSLLATCDKL